MPDRETVAINFRVKKPGMSCLESKRTGYEYVNKYVEICVCLHVNFAIMVQNYYTPKCGTIHTKFDQFAVFFGTLILTHGHTEKT